jgi:Domain of unknown function (DUF4276)
MTRVVVICEGQTEETFVRDVLEPHFSPFGLYLNAQTIETSPGHRGGALNYDRVQRQLRNTLRQTSAPVVTTFFDFYRLDKRFPGFDTAMVKGSIGSKVDTLNSALAADVVALAGCDPARFIPHIQPHEFEALLFSDVATLTGVERNWARNAVELSAIRQQSATPEHINDKPETKPAAHLERLLKSPRFSKVDHGPIAAARMGLPCIERECLHFAAWLQRIRSLAK